MIEHPATQRTGFTTPNGVPVEMTWREGCADWNNMTSSLTEDEYQLRGLTLEGVALDIGAYIGGVTVGLLTDHPALSVVSVEPLPENLALLRENATSERLRIVEGAVGGSGVIEYDFAADDGRAGDFAAQHRYYGNTFGFGLYCEGIRRYIERTGRYSRSRIHGHDYNGFSHDDRHSYCRRHDYVTILYDKKRPPQTGRPFFCLFNRF